MIKKSTIQIPRSRAPFKKKEGPTNVDVQVGARLRERRTLMGMTQDAIATATGLTFQQIQKYEQGKNRISASRLLQFSDLLNVDPNYFFLTVLDKSTRAQGLAEDQTPFQAQDIMTMKETLELVRTYYSIRDPKIRKNILKIIKQMAEGTEGQGI